jgi:hypothetical protein
VSLDANNDGKVQALDLLVVINELIASGLGPLPQPGGGEPPPYLDVSGNGSRDLVDPLSIINWLIAYPSGGGTVGTNSASDDVQSLSAPLPATVPDPGVTGDAPVIVDTYNLPTEAAPQASSVSFFAMPPAAAPGVGDANQSAATSSATPEQSASAAASASDIATASLMEEPDADETSPTRVGDDEEDTSGAADEFFAELGA